MASLYWLASTAWNLWGAATNIAAKGLKRCLGQAPSEDAAAETRIIIDSETQIPSAIEERSGSEDGSVKRRRLFRDENGQDVQFGIQSPTGKMGAGRKSRHSPLSQRYKKPPAQNITQHNVASTDLTAGIQWDLASSSTQLKTHFNPSTQNRSAQREIASTDPTAGINIPTSPSSRLRAIVASKLKHTDLKIAGTSKYGSKYDLISEQAKAARQADLYQQQTGPIRTQGKRSRPSATHPYRKVESEKKPVKYVSPFDQYQEDRKKEVESDAALQQEVEAARIAKEEKRAAQARAEAEKQRKAQAFAEKTHRMEQEKMAVEAALKARRDAREAAKAKHREEAARRKAEEEEEARKMYEERERMLENEERLEDSTSWNDRMKKVRSQRTLGSLWSPNPASELLTKSNTDINSQASGHLFYSPERKPVGPPKEVQISLSPNSGLEAVHYKMFDKAKPSTQLNSPEGRPWPRKEPFFERSFDSLLRPDNGHPVSIKPNKIYGLDPKYDDSSPSGFPNHEDTVDTSIEMTDADVSPPPSEILGTIDLLDSSKCSSIPSIENSGSESAEESSSTSLGTSGSDENGSIDDFSLEHNMSKMSMYKVACLRRAKRAREAQIQREKEAAEAKARAEAEAKEAAARKKAEEEAMAAEEERVRQGGRRMPTEPFIKPLPASWEERLDTEMSKGPEAQIAVGINGSPLHYKDFWRLLTTGEWLNDETINEYLDLTVKEGNEAAGCLKFVTFNSFFYTNLSSKGPASVSRWMKRKKAEGAKLLGLDAIFFPVNNSNHWTLIVVSPTKKTIEYLDSFGGAPGQFVTHTRSWLAQELGSKYVASEWTVPYTRCARQDNYSDCGVFAVTNAKCVAMGLDPTCYHASDMAMQRRRIAAEIINGGTIL